VFRNISSQRLMSKSERGLSQRVHHHSFYKYCLCRIHLLLQKWYFLY